MASLVSRNAGLSHRAMYLARSAAPGRLNRCSNVQYGRRQSKIRSQQSDQPSPPPPAETPPSKEHDLQLPRDVIEQLRTTVFSFNTFFVTGVENFEANGVLFKGNLRGEPAVTYVALSARLHEQLGNRYKLFLLEDKDEKPVCVVLPADATRVEVNETAEAALAALFAITALATTLNVNAASGIFNLAQLAIDPAALTAETLPGTAALFAILGAHEVGHRVAAGPRGLALAPPLLIPAGLGLLGSFGAITRIRSDVPDRQSLLEVAVAGPAAGAVASLALLLVGLGLTAAGLGGIELDANSFRDSLLVGGLGQLFLGDRLFESLSVNVSPLLCAGWAGLIVQALNVLPAGELDGGRIALGLWGRHVARALSVFSLLLLGLAGFRSSLALFWLLAVVTLQRGPIVPCDNEVSRPNGPAATVVALALFALTLLVLLPYPFASTDVGPGLPLGGDLPQINL